MNLETLVNKEMRFLRLFFAESKAIDENRAHAKKQKSV